MTRVNLRVNLLMDRKEIVFYRKSSGECPVEAFLDSLPGKVAKKVVWVLHLVEDLDRVPSQYFCKMTDTDNIWEFRIKLGSSIYRVLSFWDGNKIVLAHGFVKKTQKTPLQEIERAEDFRRDYWMRRG